MDEILLKNLAIAGYRSFGVTPQYFDSFSKINLIVGQNNSGKSNVLRVIAKILPEITKNQRAPLQPLDAHQPFNTPFILGQGKNPEDGLSEIDLLDPQGSINSQIPNYQSIIGYSVRVLRDRCLIEGRQEAWSFIHLPSGEMVQSGWPETLQALSDTEIQNFWGWLRGMRDGERNKDWEPFVRELFKAKFNVQNALLIPAVREIKNSTESPKFDGTNLIEQLARLEKPDALNQIDKQRFISIQNFLRSVMNAPEATIEIPYERDTILVHMNGISLPMESLGSGIQEVIILAAAATVHSNYVICIEEPEIHLNPILQKKLIRYLHDHTDNQYFISTHSAAMMDTPNAEIYHITLKDGCSQVRRATSDNERSTICADLGYHPSDLLQANCIIWVEGSSDRIYILHWLKKAAPDFFEGIHFSIMFYGGRLASHLTFDEESVESFIKLQRLNRRSIIVIDSDRKTKRAGLNSTKTRLKGEFDHKDGFGHCWVTSGREIENYIPEDQLRKAIEKVSPSASATSDFGQYSSCLTVKTTSQSSSTAHKVSIARFVTKTYQADMGILDLKKQVEKLVKFVKFSNPKTTR